MSALQEPSTTTHEGFVYDTASGECIGIADKPQFHVTDQSSAEWVLGKMAELDADILAYDARLKALSENIEAMKAEKQRRKDFLMYRYGPELEQFAKENLPAGKKTWTCPYGKVAFRSVASGLRVKDADLALEVAKDCGFRNAIKTVETFQISKLTDEQRKGIERLISNFGIANKAFELTEDKEAMTIQTGVS